MYCYFNKGIAYTFLAEVTWLMGILLMITQFRTLEFSWDRKLKLLLVWLGIGIIYTVRGLKQYPLMEVIRDSFIINYSWFVLIVFFLKDELPLLKQKIADVYKWFPLIVTICFQLKTIFPDLIEISLFGGIPFFLYKNGDLACHLLIATFFMMNGAINMRLRYSLLNVILIGYLFLITATYNRGGMLSYIIGLSTFLFFSRKTPLAQKYFSYLKFIPIIIIIALPIYLNTKETEQTAGRKIGIEQLKNNVTSIVKRGTEQNGLDENVVWRLAWWGKIVDYTFLGPYFFQGKGLGINLSVDDDIHMEDDSLRSPHNFHLNILARFGVPIFFLWLFFLFTMFIELKNKMASPERLTYLSIVLAFFINATFDVSLEGPMSAFPCWTFVGIAFATEVFGKEDAHA
jgi:hypothetical protein